MSTAARYHELLSTQSTMFLRSSLLEKEEEDPDSSSSWLDRVVGRARIVTLPVNDGDGVSMKVEKESHTIIHPSDSESLLLHIPKSHHSSVSTSEQEFISEDSSTTCTTTPLPPIKTTGTTIVGLLLPHFNTVILAADTRATEGTIVADKACEKIHIITDTIYACGAGTSGDLDALLRKVRYTMFLRHKQRIHHPGTPTHDINNTNNTQYSFHHTRTGRSSCTTTSSSSSVSAVCRLIRNELYDQSSSSSSSSSPLGVNLILGGYDSTWKKTILVAIHPHGSMDVNIPYAALGSGGLAAMGVLESEYRLSNLTSIEKGIEIAIHAVMAGIRNDLGSGSSIDVCIIQPPSWNSISSSSSPSNGVQYLREVVKEETLPISKQDTDILTMVKQRLLDMDTGEDGKQDNNNNIDDKFTVPMGTGGFGSVPYRIQRKSLFLMNEEKIHTRKKLWLQKMIDEDE